MIKKAFKKYEYLVLIPVLVLLLITVILILFSSGPQQGHFVYQIH